MISHSPEPSLRLVRRLAQPVAVRHRLQLRRSRRAQAGDVTVTIDASRFEPEQLTVQAGDTVVWVNKDLVAHTATSQMGDFDSGLIAPGKSWKYRTEESRRIRLCLHVPPDDEGDAPREVTGEDCTATRYKCLMSERHCMSRRLTLASRKDSRSPDATDVANLPPQHQHDRPRQHFRRRLFVAGLARSLRSREPLVLGHRRACRPRAADPVQPRTACRRQRDRLPVLPHVGRGLVVCRDSADEDVHELPLADFLEQSVSRAGSR